MKAAYILAGGQTIACIIYALGCIGLGIFAYKELRRMKKQTLRSNEELAKREECIYTCSEEELQRKYARIGEALHLQEITRSGGSEAAKAYCAEKENIKHHNSRSTNSAPEPE